MLPLVQSQLERGLPAFRGTSLRGTVPVSERVLNEAAAEFLPSTGGVRSIFLEVLPENQVRIEVSLQIGPLTPSFRLMFRIDPEIDFPDRPVVRARFVDGSGIAPLLKRLTPLVARLPEGVEFHAGGVDLDLARLLAAQGYPALAGLLRSARVTTERGRLLAAFHLAV